MTQKSALITGLPAKTELIWLSFYLTRATLCTALNAGLLSLIPRELTTFTKTHTSMIGISFFITGI